MKLANIYAHLPYICKALVIIDTTEDVGFVVDRDHGIYYKFQNISRFTNPKFTIRLEMFGQGYKLNNFEPFISGNMPGCHQYLVDVYQRID